MKIGFIGLGNMGVPIATNLLKAGHDLVVWNRSIAKAKPLTEAGATLAASPKLAATGCDAVLTMLADDAALESTVYGDQGLAAGLAAGGLHVSMSTISVATADRLSAEHRSRGQRFVAAPVFGRPPAAVAAKLFIVAAGENDDLEKAAHIFKAISQRVFEIGVTPSAANLVKLCGNFMILSSIEALGEAMALAEKGGIAKAALLDVLTGSIFTAPLFRNYGDMLVEDRYRPADFAAPLGLKDMRLAAQSANALRIPMPLLDLLQEHLRQTIANEGADIDWSGIGRTIAKNAGL